MKRMVKLSHNPSPKHKPHKVKGPVKSYCQATGTGPGPGPGPGMENGKWKMENGKWKMENGK